MLVRNYRCPAGEIDLIVSDQKTLAFVEVKTRSDEDFVDARESVRQTQWDRIRRAAHYFIHRYDAHRRPARFDLVIVVWPPRGWPEIEHIEDVDVAGRG